jgi:hypothetical protein
LRPRPIALAVVLAPIVALLASTILFYGYVRLGTAYLPAVWVLQGAALGALFGRRASPGPRACAIVVAVMVALLALEAARVGVSRPLVIDGPRTPDGVLIEDETVRITSRP